MELNIYNSFLNNIFKFDKKNVLCHMIDKWLKRYFPISVRGLSEDELLLLSPEELCKDRLSEEYFRLKADYDGGDCRDVVR